MKTGRIVAAVGCGTLLLGAIVLSVIGAIWAKRNVGGLIEVGEEWNAQTVELDKLNREHPFPPPGAVPPLALSEQRLRQYLEIRSSVVQLMEKLELEGAASEYGQERGVSDQLEKTKKLAGIGTALRAEYIKGLRAHRMSPREVIAISCAVYPGTSEDVEARRQRITASLERLKAEAGKANALRQLANGQKTRLLKQALEGLPPAGATLTADERMLHGLREELSRAANPSFDVLLAQELAAGGG